MNNSTPKILWIDDEIDLLRPHILYLKEKGYDVDITTTGKEGLRFIRDQNFDLVPLESKIANKADIALVWKPPMKKILDLSNLNLHSEWLEVNQKAVKAIKEARARGSRVIAVGTTSVRALEGAVNAFGGEL